MERLWLRFQQLGCNEDGEITEAVLQANSIWQDAFSRNVSLEHGMGNYGQFDFSVQ